MSLYKELYFKLFAAMADAVEALGQCNCEKAMKRLVEAQQEAEEAYISHEE